MTPRSSTRAEEISTARCVAYTGDARDPSLQGMPASGPARCCESDFGVDVELVLQSCGLSRYLGESEEQACVHHFADAEGREHELRLSPLLDLDPDAAARLHASSGSPALLDPHAGESSPAISWLAPTQTRSWALVSGWPALRRLSWTHETCSPEAMTPVLEAMATAPAEPLTPLPRLEFVPSPAERPGASLLSSAATSVEAGPHALPYAASAIAEALLHAVATDDLDTFAAHFETHARWGLPDRRQLSGRSVHADPRAALMALERGASRLPEGTALHCPALDRRLLPAIARGEALMWCLWLGPDQLDLIALALRGRVVDGRADARVEYLGVFPDAPLAPVALLGEPPPPPVVPTPSIVCGDPHALAYPGLCPVEELVEEDEEDGEDGEDEDGGDEGDADDEGDEALDDGDESEVLPNEAVEPTSTTPRRTGETLRLPPLD